MHINQTLIQVLRGSVTDQDVDAIVNAANTTMRGGGGIDGRIHAAAGPGLLAELERVAPDGAETGTAVITGGHGLKQRHIIHTPGPVWRGGNRGEPQALASCYRNCLRVADEHRLASIAFCSISTGIYRFPIDQAASVAIGTVIDFLNQNANISLRRIVFAMYQLTEYDIFQGALKDAEG